MRSVAVLGVLAGCNQIYGLDPTKVIDAGPPPRHVTLTYVIATEDADLKHAIALDTQVRDVRQLVASTLDGAQTVDLLADYAATGVVEVPEVLAAEPWRLAYTIGDEPPREIQNAPPGDLHVAVSMFGPLDRAPVPAGSGYSVTPVGYVGSHATNRVFTTGVWTEGSVFMAPATAQLDYSFDLAKSLFGPLGAPSATDSRVVVVDYKIDGATGCRASTGSTELALALTAGQLSVPSPQPKWDTDTITPQLQMDPIAVLNQLGSVNFLDGGNPGPSTISLGFVPSDRLPAFDAPPQLPRVLSGPVLVAVDVCPWTVGIALPVIPAFNDTGLKSDFTAVLHAEATIVRVVDSVALTSAMAVVTPRSGVSYAPLFTAPTVRAATLGGVDIFGNPASGDAEHVPVPAPTVLTFELAGGTADYIEVTLHRLDGGALLPQRRYTVFGTTVAIDPAVFTPGGQYVFEIRTFTGRPGALVGDFRIASLPQAMVTMFTRTFIAP